MGLFGVDWEMPWKIQSDSMPSGEGAKLHFADLLVDLHLEVDLKTGVVDLYIGHHDRAEAVIHIEVDAEETKAAQLIRLGRPTAKQADIVCSVLETMGFHFNILRLFRQAFHGALTQD